MKKIPLSQGKFALVDDEDFARLDWFQWYAYEHKSGNWYARRNTELGTPRKCVLMHRAVLGVSELDSDIDHKDGDGLNNQKTNLRFATRSENTANRRVPPRNKQGFRGVHLDKRSGRYAVAITTNRKQVWIGYFDTPEEGARAFDRAAIKYHGEFARTNFPVEDYR